MDLDSLVTIRVVYVVFTVLTLVWKVENYRSPASKSPTEQSVSAYMPEWRTDFLSVS